MLGIGAGAASGRLARGASCAAFALISFAPAIAEQAKTPADRTRAVELANLCLSMEGMAADDVVAAARAAHLEPESDPLVWLERYYDRLNILNVGHFDRDRFPDVSQAARKVLYPFGDPEPKMAFRDTDGWLFLVGPDATVRLSLDDLHTGAYTRYTAHSCDIYGAGWISDSEARDMLSRVLGADYAGHKTTPADAPPDHPKTIALGGSELGTPSEVHLLIESVQGIDGHGPVNELGLSTAPTAQPGKVYLDR